MAKLALKPSHPERICWGCDLYCRADDLACGNGTERTQHPIELFGDDWLEWAKEQGGYGDFDPSADRKERACSSGPMVTAAPTSDQNLPKLALNALHDVLDPELGIDIVDLGLIYRLEVDTEGQVSVDMSMTTPACPLGEHLLHEVEETLGRVPGVRGTEVRLVWQPPWSPARMSELARRALARDD
jgi:metal-sulfur cluster biosynthetic enzyme